MVVLFFVVMIIGSRTNAVDANPTAKKKKKTKRPTRRPTPFPTHEVFDEDDHENDAVHYRMLRTDAYPAVYFDVLERAVRSAARRWSRSIVNDFQPLFARSAQDVSCRDFSVAFEEGEPLVGLLVLVSIDDLDGAGGYVYVRRTIP